MQALGETSKAVPAGHLGEYEAVVVVLLEEERSISEGSKEGFLESLSRVSRRRTVLAHICWMSWLTPGQFTRYER
jgi:hypothetical protein